MVTSLDIEFPAGLPGFDRERCFRVWEDSQLTPLVFMQSQESPGLSFIALPVNRIADSYEVALADADAELLGFDPGAASANMIALALVTIPETGPTTANLLAPIVINPETGRAVQAVRCDRRYSHQHVLAEGAACS